MATLATFAVAVPEPLPVTLQVWVTGLVRTVTAYEAPVATLSPKPEVPSAERVSVVRAIFSAAPPTSAGEASHRAADREQLVMQVMATFATLPVAVPDAVAGHADPGSPGWWRTVHRVRAAGRDLSSKTKLPSAETVRSSLPLLSTGDDPLARPLHAPPMRTFGRQAGAPQAGEPLSAGRTIADVQSSVDADRGPAAAAGLSDATGVGSAHPVRRQDFGSLPEGPHADRPKRIATSATGVRIMGAAPLGVVELTISSTAGRCPTRRVGVPLNRYAHRG